MSLDTIAELVGRSADVIRQWISRFTDVKNPDWQYTDSRISRGSSDLSEDPDPAGYFHFHNLSSRHCALISFFPLDKINYI